MKGMETISKTRIAEAIASAKIHAYPDGMNYLAVEYFIAGYLGIDDKEIDKALEKIKELEQ